MRLYVPIAVVLVTAAFAVALEDTYKAADDPPTRRLRSSAWCDGSYYPYDSDCPRSGYNTGGNEYEKDYLSASTAAYVDELHADAESFIVQLRDWLRAVTSDTGLGIDATFSLNARGPVDLQRPCGSLKVQRAFRVLQRFIENPVDARLDDNSVQGVFWRPSTECFEQYGSLDVGGGAHASFEMKCGNSVLLNASIVMGGSSSKSFWRRSESSGVSVSVSFWNGRVRVLRTAGMLRGTVTEVGDTTRFASSQWISDLRTCTTSQRLAIRGVVGGGWSQRHTGLASYTGSFKPSIVGYADSFELAYPDLTGSSTTGLPWFPPNVFFPPWPPSDPNAAGNPSFPIPNLPPVNWTSSNPWNVSTNAPWPWNTTNTSGTPWPSNNQSDTWLPWFPNTTAPSGNWTWNPWNPWNVSTNAPWPWNTTNTSGTPWPSNNQSDTWLPWFPNTTAPSGNWTWNPWNPWNMSTNVPYFNGSGTPWSPSYPNGTWFPWNVNASAPGSAAGNWTWNPWNISFPVPYINGSYAPWPLNDTNGTWYRWYLNMTALSVELPSARDAKRLQDWSEAVAGSYFQSGVDCSAHHSGVSCFLTAALSQSDQRSESSPFAHAASPVGIMGVVIAAVGVVAVVAVAVARRRHSQSAYARLTPADE
ncbi:hypothetical protein PINS_up009469 [Pythium insidiosum]|nr:hypothetical protein PINS_up009469 [Pythium insidiosum]